MLSQSPQPPLYSPRRMPVNLASSPLLASPYPASSSGLSASPLPMAPSAYPSSVPPVPPLPPQQPVLNGVRSVRIDARYNGSSLLFPPSGSSAGAANGDKSLRPHDPPAPLTVS